MIHVKQEKFQSFSSISFRNLNALFSCFVLSHVQADTSAISFLNTKKNEISLPFPIPVACYRRVGLHSVAGRHTRNMGRAVALLVLCLSVARAEILTPPYFNLALGKKITATATCGDEGQELYCKLAGANADHDEHVIQGQVFLFSLLQVFSLSLPL